MARLCLLTVSLVLASANLALAVDFRVENKVYGGDLREPATESVTIFQGDMVYDCMKTPDETVVFDKGAGRFILLNMSKKVRAELPLSEIASRCEKLKPLALKSRDPLIKFLADPQFHEEAEEGNEVTLSSKLVTYKLLLSPEPNAAIVEQYREFCDQSAKLNSILVPGSRPPYGRLVVDAAIAKRSATPSLVVLTVTSGAGEKRQQTTIRSEQHLTRQLSQADLDLVAKAQEAMSKFKVVGFDDQYRKMQLR